MRPEPVLLRGLIDEIQAEWGPRAGVVTLLMSYDGDPELCVLADRQRLRQVFDNLVEPALANTRLGSVEVSLKAETAGDVVHLQGRVRDTGPGLSADALARVFDASARSGIGLGMALARQIVLAMDGRIHAESNVGAGVTMLFDFRCAVSTKAAAPTEAVSTGAAHVLVVDDNATNRMVAEALVEMFDCTSETAEDGVEAVEIARTGRFDVILMDIKMPRMDGMAATRAIRALSGPAGQTPIIALTANVDPEDARAYLACGMCAVVEKPIKPDRLLQAINDALAGAASHKQAAA
jgi:CheY-like chemotaxis protein